MRTRHLLFAAAAASLAFGAALPAFAAPPAPGAVTYMTFDVGSAIPGAVDTNVAGLTATASTPGLVVGTYRDGTGRHGFIAHTGPGFSITSIQTIDVPGSTNVHITSVNSAGTVSGFYLGTADSVEHGFIRDSAGGLTVLDDPSAVPAASSSTFAGPPFYSDPFFGGTFPGQVTGNGTVIGFYSVADTSGNTVLHGFTWAAPVTWKTIDAPNALTSYSPGAGAYLGTYLYGMTTAGSQVGAVILNNRKTGTGTQQGLLINGKTGNEKNYIDTAVPMALPTNWCGWTAITAINDAGTMVGNAGNGCSANQYAWLLTGSKWTNLQYTDTANTATETIVSGQSPAGIMTGAWNTWPGEPGGNWLSPDNPAGYGLWHGFIAIPS
jgi:hypothetical protein